MKKRHRVQSRFTIKFIYRAINMAVLMLLCLSLFLSLQSEILYIDKLAYKFIAFLFFLFLFFYVLLLFFNKKNLIKILNIIKKEEATIFWSFFIFCIFYQLFLFFNLKATPNYDSSLLLHGIQDKNLLIDYLSANSNNRFIFFFNLLLSNFIGTSILNFQIFNALIIFCSILLFKHITTKLFNRSIAYIATILLMCYSIIQPLYLVPYTDTYCLLPMFLSILFLINSIDSKKISKVIMNSILSGVFFSICYFIRPSAIIFIIAILIFVVINITDKKVLNCLCKIIPGFGISVLFTLFLFNVFINTQNIVKIDRSKEIPFTHFLLLGSFGDEDDRNALHGTYNIADLKFTRSHKDKSKMVAANLSALKERTLNRGFSKTIKFNIQKYRQNTDSGVVGYHRDGLWINSIYSKDGTLKNKVQQIYYEDGKLRPTFNFICQIMWIITLLFAIFGLINNRNWKVSLVALTLFGGLLFLQLFESGGTKYLFQYIPWICLLSSLGAHSFIKYVLKKQSS